MIQVTTYLTVLKRFFSFLLISATGFVAVAQPSTTPVQSSTSGRLWYGVRLNANKTFLGSAKSDSLSGAFSAGGGFFAAYAINKFIRPQLEVEYSTISYVKTTDERTNKNYLDLGFNLLIKPGNKTNLIISTGIQAAICQGITNVLLSSSSASGTTKVYNNAETGRIDYLWNLGVAIPASTKVDFFARYHKSLTGKTTPSRIEGKTDYLQFGITVNLNKFLEENKEPSGKELEDQEDMSVLGKGGVLLVRLNYQRNLIDWYEKNNRFIEADSIRKTNDTFNLELMQAFRKYYKYTPVYFFKDEKSYDVASGNTHGVFVNDQLETDTTISIGNKSFLIAEVGFVESFTGSTIDNMLVVLNAKFKQMKSPFPYSTNNLKAFQTYRRFLVNVKESDFSNPTEIQVYVLNQRISAFYQQYNPLYQQEE